MSVIVNEVKVKAVPKKTIVYNKFRGVDFSTDPALVDRMRSPYALNLISDTAGMPEKRLGWRQVHKVAGTPEPAVHGLYYGEVNGNQLMITHIGDKLYKFTDTTITQIASSVPDKEGCGFFMKYMGVSYFYYICSGKYLRYNGSTTVDLSTNGYVPTILISKNPDGTGGTVYESINLITDQKCESFLGNNSDTDYYLSVKPVTSIDKVEVMDANGVFQVITTGFSVNTTDGKVSFTSPQNPVIAGQDNVRITYTKTITGYQARINKCTIVTKYGYGGENRVFLSGNPDYPNYEWYSEVDNPEYMPDINYCTAGDGTSAIMGYLKMGKYLLVVKDGAGHDSTLYQQWGDMDSNGDVTFPIERGVSGIGAVAKKSFESLIDEPLFLTAKGIYAVADANILAERALKNRSFYVDNWLLKESNLNKAVCCDWGGYYLLCVNSNCYVFDSRNKSYRSNQSYTSSDFLYDSYLWNNIPAVCFLPMDEELYFGTEDGRICKFNTDKPNMDKYNDNGFLLDPDDGSDGDPIVAIWSTKNDDDGASYFYKSMLKKGCSVTIKPFTKSSVEVYVSKDGNDQKFIRDGRLDLLAGFNDIDFENFTFMTNVTPQDIYLKKKVKKYKRLQIIVRNSEKSEGFGVFQITKTFRVGSYAKK